MIIFFILSSLPLADSFYQENDFYNAATEYERFLFYCPDDSLADYARLRLGLSYAGAGDFSKAEKTLKGLCDHSPPWAKKAQLNLIKTYISEENYPLAQLELTDLLLFSPESEGKKELYRLSGFLNLFEQNLADATENFRMAQADSLLAATAALKQLPKRNPSLSAVLSTILPGSGEIYCGRYRIGLSALLAHGLCIGGIVYTIKTKKYLDAVLIFSFLFPRFYFGSQRNARDFAEDYNEIAYKLRLEGLLKTYNFKETVERIGQ